MDTGKNLNISWPILRELARVQSSGLKFGIIRGSSSILFVTECICTLCLCCCMYSVCRSVGDLSCVYVSRSFTYALRVDLDVTMRRHCKSEREKARGNNNELSYVPSTRKEEIKSGTSGCGSFVVPYFQPATSSTDCLHLALRSGLEVGKPNNIPANNRRACNDHSQRGQRKNYSDEQLSFFCNLCQVLVCPKCPPDGHK